MQTTSDLILDLLIKHFVVGSITGMTIFSLITLVLPLVMTIHNKLSKDTEIF